MALAETLARPQAETAGHRHPTGRARRPRPGRGIRLPAPGAFALSRPRLTARHSKPEAHRHRDRLRATRRAGGKPAARTARPGRALAHVRGTGPRTVRKRGEREGSEGQQEVKKTAP